MRVGHLFFFTGHAGELVAVAGRQGLCGYFLYGIDDIARTVTAGRHSLYVDGREHVEAGQRFRTVSLGQFDELTDRGHTARSLYKDVVERLHAFSFVGRSLDDDTVQFGEAVEVGNIEASIVT